LIAEMGQRVKTVDTSINRYELLLVKKNKLIQITLLGSIAAVFLTLSMMFFAGYNYSSQVNQMNALSISLARRLSEVNSGLVTFEQINQSISSLSNSTENLMVTTEMQSETLTQGLTDIQSLLAASATETDASLTQLQANVAQEMSGILQDTRSSSAGIVRAIEQVGAAQRGLQETTPTLRELVALREQISALIVLERNQYLETIAATQSAAAAEVAPSAPRMALASPQSRILGLSGPPLTRRVRPMLALFTSRCSTGDPAAPPPPAPPPPPPPPPPPSPPPSASSRRPWR
jgi:hypothetical protein